MGVHSTKSNDKDPVINVLQSYSQYQNWINIFFSLKTIVLIVYT